MLRIEASDLTPNYVPTLIRELETVNAFRRNNSGNQYLQTGSGQNLFDSTMCHYWTFLIHCLVEAEQVLFSRTECIMILMQGTL